MNKKLLLLSGLVILLSGVLFKGAWAQNVSTDIPTDYDGLKKKYETLFAEYINIMAQSKVLLQMKEKAQNLEEALQRFSQEKEIIIKKAVQEKEDIIKQFKQEKESLTSQLTSSKEELSSQWAQEKETLTKGRDEFVKKATQEKDDIIKQFKQEREGLMSQLARVKEDTAGQLAQEKAALAKEREELANRVKQDIEDGTHQLTLEKDALMKERDGALTQAAESSARVKRLNESIASLMKERDEYKKSFEKASVNNIIGEEARKKIIELENENASLIKQHDESQDKVRIIDSELLKRQAETELMRRQLSELKEKYEEARKQNRGLESKLEALPGNFTELARENKILVKRTSLMHYNLGVFYTQNKEFNRAIPEFENAVELNPEDGLSYFNLGYIYAEHLQNRPKAVENFRKFLKLAKKDDKDADWAKRYILTWQAWEGGSPIK